jgi:citrate lyase subunit beta/citryl-CoA lyase
MSFVPFAITWLFVPGDRPDRFGKALASDADEVIIDLEDAVAAQTKPRARDVTVDWLGSGGRAWVRVNGYDTLWHDADLSALVGLAGLNGIVVPKAARPDVLEDVGRLLEAPIIALIESAVGIHRAFDIAEAAAVHRLALGSIDLALDLNARETDTALLLARSSVVIASRVADLPPPIDGVTPNIAEPAEVARDAAHARELGFGGKLCIHPAQIAAARAAFLPTSDELSWAHKVLAAAAASGGTATQVDGRLIDQPIQRLARRILDQHISDQRTAGVEEVGNTSPTPPESG